MVAFLTALLTVGSINAIFFSSLNKEGESTLLSINMGRRNTQNFVFVSFNQLIKQIEYKGERVGIKVYVKDEGYTSKASALDRDLIPDYDPDNKYRCEFSGYRVPPMQGRKSKTEIANERYATGIFGLTRTSITTPGDYIRPNRVTKFTAMWTVLTTSVESTR